MHPGHPLHQYSWAQPEARCLPAARGGSVITGPRGTSHPPARMYTQVAPYSMFWYNAKTEALLPSRFGREDTYWEGRRDTSPSMGPGSRWPSAGITDGHGTLEDGRGGGIRPNGDSNPGCNYLVRGYSPSMHFFWGGDMTHYSPPLPFRRGRAGCPCALASPHGRPAWGSRSSTLAGVPRPSPRVTARPGLSVRPRPHLVAKAPHFSPVCAPLLSEFFNFLTDISV